MARVDADCVGMDGNTAAGRVCVWITSGTRVDTWFCPVVWARGCTGVTTFWDVVGSVEGKDCVKASVGKAGTGVEIWVCTGAEAGIGANGDFSV